MPVIAADVAGATGIALINSTGHIGADHPGTVAFGPITTGTALTDSLGHTLTVHGQTILLTELDPTHLVAYLNPANIAGSEVFTITLNPDDTYTFDLLQKIDNGSGLNFSAFTGVSGGNSDFFAIDTDPGASNTPDLLVTGGNPTTDTVNTNNTLFGINSNFVMAGETIRFEFVNYQSAFPSHPTDAQLFTVLGEPTVSFNAQTDFTFGMANINNTSQIKITAGTESDVYIHNAATTFTDVHLSEVIIMNGTTQEADFTINGAAQNGRDVVFNLDGSVNVTGLHQGDVVEIFSNTAFDRST